MNAVAVGQLDGRPVALSGSYDATVRVWDLATGTPIGDPFTGHRGPVNAVAVGQLDGRPVALSGSSDATVRVWDLATGEPIGDPFISRGGPVRAVAAQVRQKSLADRIIHSSRHRGYKHSHNRTDAR